MKPRARHHVPVGWLCVGHKVHGWFVPQPPGSYVSLSFPVAPASPLLANHGLSSSVFYSQLKGPPNPLFLSEFTMCTPSGGLCFSACFRKSQGVLYQTWLMHSFRPSGSSFSSHGHSGEVHVGFVPLHAGTAWRHLALGLLSDLVHHTPRKFTGHSCAQPQNAGQ